MATTAQILTFDQLGAYMQRMGQQVLDLDFTPALQDVATYLASKVRQNFDEGHEPDGTPWAALLNPSRKRGGASAKPLRDTGKLMGSVFGEIIKSDAVVSVAGVRVGARADYASYHQRGTGDFRDRLTKGVRPAGAKGVIARPLVGVTPAQEQTCADIFLDFARKSLAEPRKSGAGIGAWLRSWFA